MVSRILLNDSIDFGINSLFHENPIIFFTQLIHLGLEISILYCGTHLCVFFIKNVFVWYVHKFQKVYVFGVDYKNNFYIANKLTFNHTKKQ